jgi:hypothetical protein
MQVSDVKAEIEKGQGSAYPANGQVIIFQGKVSCLCCILPACAVLCAHQRSSMAATRMLLTDPLAFWQVLKDDTTLDDNKVSENGFMVVMVTKVWAGPAAPEAEQTFTHSHRDYMAVAQAARCVRAAEDAGKACRHTRACLPACRGANFGVRCALPSHAGLPSLLWTIQLKAVCNAVQAPATEPAASTPASAPAEAAAR